MKLSAEIVAEILRLSANHVPQKVIARSVGVTLGQVERQVMKARKTPPNARNVHRMVLSQSDLGAEIAAAKAEAPNTPPFKAGNLEW